MIDPEYGVQAIAWTLVWAASGLVVRGWLAGRERRDHSR